MIVIDRQDICISYGDTFDVDFVLPYGYSLPENCAINFSVKATPASGDILLSKEIAYTSDNKISVYITANEMLTLKPGKYSYDLNINKSGEITTLNFPAVLEIKGVNHLV